MKNNLFVYGCSFTMCAETSKQVKHAYSDNYRKNIYDISWPEIIAKNKNLKLHNYGMGLNSNDKIFYSILDSFHLIGENDVVIIQVSFHHRYDIPDLDDEQLITIAPNPEQLLNGLYKKDNKLYNKSEVEHLTYMSVLMESELFKERNNKRFNFIKDILLNYKKVKSCILWELESTFHQYELIREATNGEMDDAHWSFKGNRDFANYMLKKL